MLFAIQHAAEKLLDGGCLIAAWLIIDAQMKSHTTLRISAIQKLVSRWARSGLAGGLRPKLVQLQLVRNALLWLLRVYAYLFHLVLGLLLAGMGIVALASDTSLTLGMLPWQGPSLTRATLLLGVAGIICVALAVPGLARWLFPLWALFALILMLRGFFLSPYTFSSAAEFKFAVCITIAAFVAFLASLSLFGRRRPHR
jgi:hypothetical protein